MKTYSRWIVAAAVLCTAATSFAQGPHDRYYARPESIPEVQRQQPQLNYFRTVFDVETAEPVPDVAYRVEYKYLEGYGEPGWHVHSTHFSHENAQQSLTWVLLHLVCEGRIVEFTPQPEWERVATFDTEQQAQAHASELADTGLLTRVRSRQVPRFELQERPHRDLEIHRP